ncbi:MAG: ATP-dependent DNA helicase [Melioribacteraceae bacterium]|nr:ATP-dependent DNA helicase [Melioribacteraceae bacterium]MCO6474935.1 ATP-dependent DNA helicase RecQ [Melioribacteraceae bacterium]MDD3558208.1 ATP-dependent DNA helicase [Melioribacteraceae bacterium]
MEQKIYDILKKHWGYNSFKGLQKQIIDRTLIKKKHSLVLMPTGAGKSLCYQVPAMIFEGGTLVISPLIALMQDQVDGLRKCGIPASFINSTVSKSKREERLQNFVSGKIKLLYVTPERFRKNTFIGKIKEADISLLAVDEAHCISEWGHDFRPDYSRIGEFRAMLGNPLTIALTATATKDVQADIIKKLNLDKNEIKIFHQGIERPNLRLEVANTYDFESKFKLISQVIEEYSGPGIIYFSLIKTLSEFSEYLERKGIKHNVYHGKLDASERKKMQYNFMSGASNIVLATNAFGMGVDKADIRFVIHAEVTSSVESYYQEIGRSGRDGLASLCILLYSQNDLLTQMEFIKWSNPNADYYHRVFDLLMANKDKLNSLDVDYFREQMSFKDKNDFRLETVFSMLDRYGVTEGSLEEKNLEVVSTLPEQLSDDDYLNEKLLSDNKKLLALVNYINNKNCRRVYISDYFGFPGEKDCRNCDNCSIKYGE